MSACYCDTFADSYSCVFRRCVGYPSPYPIVRLGTNHRDGEDMVCVALRHADGILLKLKAEADTPCASFLHLIASDWPPIKIFQDTEHRFAKEVEEKNGVTALVSLQSQKNIFSASFFTSGESASPISSCTVKHITSVSLTSQHVWSSTATEVACIDYTSLFNGGDPFFVKTNHIASRIFNITSLSSTTAGVFCSEKFFSVDSREEKPSGVLVETTKEMGEMCSGNIAADHYVVCYTFERKLVVFDIRYPVKPLSCRGSPSFLEVRSEVGRETALLLSGDQIGLLHVPSSSVLCAFQLPFDDGVLDAGFLCVPGRQAIRASSASGTIFDFCIPS